MADTTTSTTVSRRSTRLFLEEQSSAEAGTVGQMERESRNVSEETEQERPQKPQKRTPPANSLDGPMIPLVDFGMDLSGLFPSALEDMKDHGMPSIICCKSTY